MDAVDVRGGRAARCDVWIRGRRRSRVSGVGQLKLGTTALLNAFTVTEPDGTTFLLVSVPSSDEEWEALAAPARPTRSPAMNRR